LWTSRPSSTTRLSLSTSYHFWTFSKKIWRMSA
jgi:hypothetical protein